MKLGEFYLALTLLSVSFLANPAHAADLAAKQTHTTVTSPPAKTITKPISSSNKTATKPTNKTVNKTVKISKKEIITNLGGNEFYIRAKDEIVTAIEMQPSVVDKIEKKTATPNKKEMSMRVNNIVEKLLKNKKIENSEASNVTPLPKPTAAVQKT